MTTTRPMSRRRGLLQMHAATVLFGASAVFGRLIATGPATIVVGRAAVALVAASLICATRREAPWRLDAPVVLTLGLTGALLAAHWVAFFAAVKAGGVAVATLGFASFPAFVAGFEALAFKERLTKAECLLMLMVTVGLVLVTPSFGALDTSTRGLLYAVASGFLYAIVAVSNRRNERRVSSTQAAWWQYVAIVACLLPFTAAGIPQVSTMDWVWVACLGLFCTALAYGLFVASLAALQARTAAVIVSLEPVYAIAAAWWLFGERPGPRMAAGGALIVAAAIQIGRGKG